MTSPFRNYDAWLEKPFQDRCREEEEFFNWCDANDVDSDDDGAEQQYQDWLDSQEEIGPDPDDARELAYEDERDGYERDYGD